MNEKFSEMNKEFSEINKEFSDLNKEYTYCYSSWFNKLWQDDGQHIGGVEFSTLMAEYFRHRISISDSYQMHITERENIDIIYTMYKNPMKYSVKKIK